MSDSAEVRREKLLALLPTELQERWEEASLEDIEWVTQKRERLGFDKVVGYHVSGMNLPAGAVLTPGDEGDVFYSERIDQLYGRHGGGFIYVVEGTSMDEQIDTTLGWRKTRGAVRIIDKIDINPQSMAALGAGFARVEYHV